MKDWYKSKTIWAGILAAGSGAIGMTLGVTVDPMTGDFTGNVYEIAGKLAPWAGTILGGAGAIFGRVHASTEIKPRKKVR